MTLHNHTVFACTLDRLLDYNPIQSVNLWKEAEVRTHSYVTSSIVELALVRLTKYQELCGLSQQQQQNEKTHREYRQLAESIAKGLGVPYLSEKFRAMESRWVSELLHRCTTQQQEWCMSQLTPFGFTLTPPVPVPTDAIGVLFQIPGPKKELKNPIKIEELVSDSDNLSFAEENFLFAYLEMQLLRGNNSWKPFPTSNPLPKERSAQYSENRRDAIAKEQIRQQASGGTEELMAQRFFVSKQDISVAYQIPFQGTQYTWSYLGFVIPALAQLLIERADEGSPYRLLSENDRLEWALYEAGKLLTIEHWFQKVNLLQTYSKGRLRTTEENAQLKGWSFKFEDESKELEYLQHAKSRFVLAHEMQGEFRRKLVRVQAQLQPLSQESRVAIQQLIEEIGGEHAKIDDWIMARHKRQVRGELLPTPPEMSRMSELTQNVVDVNCTAEMMELCHEFYLGILTSLQTLLGQDLDQETLVEAIFRQEHFRTHFVEKLMAAITPILTSPIGRLRAWEYVHFRTPEALRRLIRRPQQINAGIARQILNWNDFVAASRISEKIVSHFETLQDASQVQETTSYIELVTGLLHAISVGEILAQDSTPEEERHIALKLPLGYEPREVKATFLSHMMARRLALAPKAAEQIGRQVHYQLLQTVSIDDYMDYVREHLRQE